MRNGTFTACPRKKDATLVRLGENLRKVREERGLSLNYLYAIRLVVRGRVHLRAHRIRYEISGWKGMKDRSQALRVLHVRIEPETVIIAAHDDRHAAMKRVHQLVLRDKKEPAWTNAGSRDGRSRTGPNAQIRDRPESCTDTACREMRLRMPQCE
jgi:hypothetical protein